MTELVRPHSGASPFERSIEAWLDAPRAHDEPSFVALLRKRAAGLIEQNGLPHPKLEHWRFTPVRSIVNVAFTPAPSVDPDLELRAWVDETLGASDAFRVLVVNGRPQLPDANAPAGVEVFGIAELLRTAPERLEPVLGQIAPPLHGFNALNDALFDDGIAIFTRKDATLSRPLEIVHLGVSKDAPVLAAPRLLVVAEAGSELSLIETHLHQGAFSALTLSVVELVIGENARLEHVRIGHGKNEAQSIALLGVRQLQNSRFVSRVASFGGKLQRLDLQVRLAEQGAECTLDGLYFVDGEEHVDHQTLIDHAAPHGTSLEKYKGVLAGRGHAVFDGTIVVAKGALKTSAHQENRNILLSDDAVINTKPHLEIDADDVRCSHGATVGQIDPDQVHYLRTRGIDLLTARTIVSFAFAREIVDRVPNEAVRRQLTRAILGRLPHGQLLEELAS
jgi:Fe-S cluster assembly protein SufD